jgi:signal transduction histidine kinase
LRKPLLLLLLLLAGCGLAAPARAELRPVVLQLQWDHQFQFAGYYAALWQGFFREAGFDVEIRSSFPDGRPVYRSPATEVSEGRAQFGTANAGLLLAAAQGAPLSIVASIFQQSGTRLYYRRELGQVLGPADLVGLRLGRNQGNELLDIELRAMLAAEGIDPARIPVVRYPPNRLLRALADGEYDMTFGYSLSAPWEQRELGVSFGELRPADYGIAFYGDSLFTHRDLAEREPEMVARFRAAALRGWAWALENPEALADRITAELPRVLPIRDLRGFNRFQIPIVRELTLHPIVQLGNINPDRWRRMASLLIRAGVLPPTGLDVDRLLFDPERDRDRRAERLQRVLLLALGVAFVLAGLATVWVIALRRAAGRIRQELARSQAALVASQKLESIGRMTGGVAHDVNNLLQVVSSGLNLLDQAELDEGRRAMVLDAMRQALERGAAVNRQLLAFSRDQELLPARLLPADCLERMRPLLRHALRDDVSLELELPPESWPVFADLTQLEVALLNLAVNAADAMPEGGRLRVALSNEMLAEPPGQADRLVGEHVRIAVTDTGEGMPPALLDRVFEPFFTTKPRGKGTGLGLAQVYGFARQSGGAARIASRPGQGTTVSILLPRLREAAGAAAPLRPAGGRPLRFLLVEEDADVAALLAASLAQMGHEAEHAPGGAQALARLAAGPRPDIVLADMTLAGMDGPALGAELARRDPGLPVVLMSGFQGQVARAAAEGRLVLRKPFTRAELDAALGLALGAAPAALRGATAA